MGLKKFISILYMLLAFIFLAKDLAYFVSRILDPTEYSIDLEKEGSTEKSEKEDSKEKEIYEEDQFCNIVEILFEDGVSQAFFISHQERAYPAPYFEIISPPPELV